MTKKHKIYKAKIIGYKSKLSSKEELGGFDQVLIDCGFISKRNKYTYSTYDIEIKNVSDDLVSNEAKDVFDICYATCFLSMTDLVKIGADNLAEHFSKLINKKVIAVFWKKPAFAGSNKVYDIQTFVSDQYNVSWYQLKGKRLKLVLFLAENAKFIPGPNVSKPALVGAKLKENKNENKKI